ncbi:unnamed protein product [[Candida] boidinii]|nr:unnamed protein product [[Candida] boidinii]
MPYLDEESFVNDVTKIFGERSMEDVKFNRIKLEKRLDFAIIGILLLILRFAHLSMLRNYDNDSSEPVFTDDEKYLLENPIGIEVTNVAQLCLNQFRLLRRSTLCIFQCALYMRLYHSYAPEDGDGLDGGDSQIFTGMLIQMGISIGLNRDPGNLDSFDDGKLVNLWRKIWYCLIGADNYQCYALGNPQMTRKEFFDTKLPEFEIKSSNIKDYELEKNVIDIIREREKVHTLTSNLTDLVSNIRDPPTVMIILKKISETENFIKENYGHLRNILTPTNHNHIDNIKKVKKICSYCDLITLLHPIYYHLFLHYEIKGNSELCREIIKSILKIIMNVVANFVDLIKNSHKYVGHGFDLILTPTLETTMHKTLQFQFALYLRCHNYRKELIDKSEGKNEEEIKHNKIVVERITKFATNLYSNIEKYVKGLNVINHKYYYAWRMSKAQSIILTMLKEKDSLFYDINESIKKTSKYSNEKIPKFSIFINSTPEYFDELINVINPDSYLQKFLSSSSSENSSINGKNSDSSNTKVDTQELDNFWVDLLTKSTNNMLDPNANIGFASGNTFAPVNSATTAAMVANDYRTFVKEAL